MNPDLKKEFRCGVVSIVGRPNVGKSTLLNAIIREKVAIVSRVPQTTRNQIRGIYNDERGQIIFVDTPGLVLGKDKLDKYLKKACLSTIHEADCIIHLVDANESTGREEEELVERLNDVKVPIIVGLNKVDKKGKNIHEYISLWERTKGKSITALDSIVLLPLSGKTGTNKEKLLDLLFERLPAGPALYPTDTISDMPQKLLVAEIIREKLLGLLRDEVPHSIAVIVEVMEPRKGNVTYIRAVILVERDSQKEIVIGKRGDMLKKVGTLARVELEGLLGTKIFLETYVKAKSKWRDNVGLLEQLGYSD